MKKFLCITAITLISTLLTGESFAGKGGRGLSSSQARARERVEGAARSRAAARTILRSQTQTDSVRPYEIEEKPLPRTGHVTVQLSAEERADLEAMRDIIQAGTTDRISLATVLRMGMREMKVKILKK